MAKFAAAAEVVFGWRGWVEGATEAEAKEVIKALVVDADGNIDFSRVQLMDVMIRLERIRHEKQEAAIAEVTEGAA